MSSRNRKRKLAQDDSSRPPRRQPRSAPRPSAVAAEPPQTDFDFHIDPNAGHGGSDRPAGYNPALYIQAYEADVVRGPQAWTNARALEVRTVAGDDLGATAGGVAPGEGLIRWRGANIDDGADEIWVDRYDVRLLLDTLPPPPAPAPASSIQRTASPTPSVSGWSDLPSDAEDTFFLTPSEIEDYTRDKRRKALDRDREARLRALGDDSDEAHPSNAHPDRWGGSDEEPDAAQRTLMERTAAQLARAANGTQLALRILAHHGADARFAFLRGRWPRAWARIQQRVADDAAEKARAAERAALGGLAGYGDSGSEGDDEEAEDGHVGREDKGQDTGRARDTAEDDLLVAKQDGQDQPGGGGQDAVNDATVQEARRARAREWAEKRRAAKGADTDA